MRDPEESTCTTSPSDVEAKTPWPPTPGHMAMMPPRNPSTAMSQCLPKSLLDKERGVGPLFAQPGAWAAQSHGEVNGSAAVLRDRGTESTISRRRNFFPMFPAVLAAISAFAAGGDYESLGLCAGENLVHVGIIQSFGCGVQCRPPSSLTSMPPTSMAA